MILISSGYLFDVLWFSCIQDSGFSNSFSEETCPHVEPNVDHTLSTVRENRVQRNGKKNYRLKSSIVIIHLVNPICTRFIVNDASMTI